MFSATGVYSAVDRRRDYSWIPFFVSGFFLLVKPFPSLCLLARSRPQSPHFSTRLWATGGSEDLCAAQDLYGGTP